MKKYTRQQWLDVRNKLKKNIIFIGGLRKLYPDDDKIRELFNIFQAEKCGCHIITVPNDLLSKLSNIGKNLEEFSLETVKMFYNDALNAGYTI